MKNLYIFLIISCFGCSTKRNLSCIENQDFKKVFFYNIEIIELHTLRQKTNGSFLNALDFLSQYVDVSYDKVYNYEVRYSTYESFKLDKEKWLKWYDENKCTYIQIK